MLTWNVPIKIAYILPALDFGFLTRLLSLFLLVYSIYLAFKSFKSDKIIMVVPVAIQLILLAIFVSSGAIKETDVLFIINAPSLAVTLAAVIVCATVLRFDIKIRGIFILSLFGLITVDNLLWMYFFWLAAGICLLKAGSIIKRDAFTGNGIIKLLTANLITGIFIIAVTMFIFFTRGNMLLSSAPRDLILNALTRLGPVALAAFQIATALYLSACRRKFSEILSHKRSELS